MRNHTNTAWLLLGLFFTSFTLAGSPDGLRELDRVSRWVSPSVDTARLIAEDLDRESKRLPPRVGLKIPTNLAPGRTGTWETLAGGDRLWRLVVRTAGARWMVLGFGEFDLQPGARLSVYEPDRARTVGPYTSADIQSHGELWTPPIDGDTVVVELFWPHALAGQEPRLRLTNVSHGYKSYAFESVDEDPESRIAGGSGACNIDIACPEGDAFEDERRGVVRLLIDGSSLCSGSLIKSNEAVCQPYVLTADHCYTDSGGTAAGTSFLFNYEKPACGGGAAAQTDIVVGSTLVANSPDSDFRLLRIGGLPPAVFDAYFNGWSRSSVPATQTWTIHHPSGDVKKISHDTEPLTVGTLQPPGSHWRVGNWEEGTTEPGSSGGPLFDQFRRIVGQLDGGLASCAFDSFDEFGRLDVAWEGGGTPATRLKDWLDPGNSGILTLDGFDASFCSVFTPQLAFAGTVVGDASGNADGPADPGETIALQVSLSNESPIGATSVAGTLTTSDTGVTILDGNATWPDIGAFDAQLSTAPHYSVELAAGYPCGEPIAFQISLTSNETGGATQFSLPTGRVVDADDVFSDDMESGLNGWASVNLFFSNPWTQTTAQSNSPSHSWFVANQSGVRDSALVMPVIVDLPAESTLTFMHWINSELGFDGGVLEYSTDGSTWLDAGDLITVGGYNGSISVGFSSRLEGREAWTGDLAGFTMVQVDLSSLAGEDLNMRWRFGSDQTGGAVGWYVDDVVVTSAVRDCSEGPRVLLPGAACTGDRDHTGTRSYVCGQAPDRWPSRAPRQGRVGRP